MAASAGWKNLDLFQCHNLSASGDVYEHFHGDKNVGKTSTRAKRVYIDKVQTSSLLQSSREEGWKVVKNESTANTLEWVGEKLIEQSSQQHVGDELKTAAECIAMSLKLI